MANHRLSSKLAKFSHYTVLFIYVHASTTVISEPDDVTVCEGRSTTFTCVLDSSISSDDVQWYRLIMDTSTTVMVDPQDSNIQFTTSTINNTLTSLLTIPWQRCIILSQKNLCHKSTTLYRFLQISTKSINIYHQKHPATVCGSPGHATITENSLINICLSASHNLHVTVEAIITSQLIPCLHWFSMVAKKNRLQTRVRCTISADLVLQISTNNLTFTTSCV